MKKYYPHVMSTLAVFVALGGGAYAATVATANNALHLGGVPAKSFRQDVVGGLNTSTAKVLPGKPTPVVGATLHNSHRQGDGFTSISGVTINNPGPDPAEVKFLLLLNGKQEPGSFTTTIDAGATQTVPAIFAFEPKCKKCFLLNLGNNDVQLVAQTQGKSTLVIEDSSLFALRPLVVPPMTPAACCGPMPMPGVARDAGRHRRH